VQNNPATRQRAEGLRKMEMGRQVGNAPPGWKD